VDDTTYTAADLELFVDLERAAAAVGVAPCLIGAGAIQLGSALGWGVRLGRTTRDWDFAVRVDSFEQYEDLVRRLVGERDFAPAPEPHRFRHRADGVLDVLPYGGVERPAGIVRWRDGTVFEVGGFCALDEHHASHRLGPTTLRLASLAVVVGLKLLAHRARGPGVARDIADVVAILEGVERSVREDRIEAEALERLGAEDVRFSEVGAYLLGRDAGRAFPPAVLESLGSILMQAEDPAARTLARVLGSSSSGADRETVVSRLRAFRIGLDDR
jgi:predicted nucleotidyltransferase